MRADAGEGLGTGRKSDIDPLAAVGVIGVRGFHFGGRDSEDEASNPVACLTGPALSPAQFGSRFAGLAGNTAPDLARFRMKSV